MIMTRYIDANLYCDLFMRRAVTGILDFLDKTPIDQVLNKHATTETAIRGSEFVATRNCVELFIDIRTKLRHLGVMIIGSSYVWR